MFVTAAAAWQFVLAIHILAVIVSFGVLFIYPLFHAIGVRLEAPAVPWFHRLQSRVHLRVQAPGLVVLVLAGIYLASDLHDWGDFFVGWGLAAAIVIGAIGGAYISPREKRLIELSERELATMPAAGSQFTWSLEYRTAARQADLARLLQLAIAVVTIVFMSVQLG
jgi:hypothetical protein